jgi:hypothetical protein
VTTVTSSTDVHAFISEHADILVLPPGDHTDMMVSLLRVEDQDTGGAKELSKGIYIAIMWLSQPRFFGSRAQANEV